MRPTLTRFFSFPVISTGAADVLHYVVYQKTFHAFRLQFPICGLSFAVSSSLRSLLDAEMGHSSRLRCDHDSLARQLVQAEECHTTRVQTLARYLIATLA